MRKIFVPDINKIGRDLFFLFLLLFLSSFANCPQLKVRTEPLYPNYLASNRVNTLDPWKNCFFGEQIVVFYRYPTAVLSEKKLHVVFRFKDHSFKELTCPLNKRKGYWIYRLINEDYFGSGGILSYKIELLENDTVIAMWKHHLYVDLLEIPHCEEESIVSLSDLIPVK